MKHPSPVGTCVSVSAPSVAELPATVGYEFVALDAEHTSMSYETMGNLLRAVDAASGETETLVRVPDGDPTTLKRALDLGPTGILVPMVETAEQAEAIVKASRHPPDGRRGLGLARTSDYGLSLAEHAETAEESFARFVQLESERAVENAADIVAVEGIDGVFVGPVDLSVSMGRLGEWDDGEFLAAVDRIVDVAREADVGVGTLVTDAGEREARLEWDVDYIIAGVDVVHLADAAMAAREHTLNLTERDG